MKQFIATLAIVGTAYAQVTPTTPTADVAAVDANGEPIIEEVQPSSACLYCRNQDLNAGFLVSYDYCQQQDICLKDAWNYIVRDCLTEWQSGSTIAIDDCSPAVASCPSFVSTPEKYQKYVNKTWNLGPGGKCLVSVDATAGIARVIFSSTLYLGIEYDAKIDEVITFTDGVNEIEIYNAAESGPITFQISFSNAYYGMVTSAVTAAALAVTALSF